MGENHNINDLVENSLLVVLPFEYVNKKTGLTWRELYFGIKCGYILPDAAIEKAVTMIAQENELSTTLFDLGSLYKHEVSQAESYLIELANQEPQQNQHTIKDKWLYLVLSWLYEIQERYNTLYAEGSYPIENIFEKVSIVWSDFNNTSVIDDLLLDNYNTSSPPVFIIQEGEKNLSGFCRVLEEFLNKQQNIFNSL